MFGKKKTKTPQKKQELTPWEKAQQLQRQSAKTSATPKAKTSFHFGHKMRLWLVVGGLLILLVGGYLGSSLSKVQSVKVVGNHQFSRAQILKMGKVNKNDWIFRYWFGKSDRSDQVYKKQPQLLRYQVSRQGWNKLKVVVKENPIAGLVFRNNTYYTILDNGKVIDKAKQQPSGNYPVFKKFHEASVLKALLTQYKKLPNVVRTGISEIDYVPSKDNPNRLHLYMNDGNEVYAVLPSFAEKMQYYPQMAAAMKQKGVIDLEVGAYSYPFKNRSKESQQTSSSASSSTVSRTNSSSSQLTSRESNVVSASSSVSTTNQTGQE
ncbi:cell division protein FtsQ/DivIB [Pediococcus cellicola]|nr:cell division protein FtsQ/DivIB [Pediococcus cellicola]